MSSSEGKEDSVVHADSGATDSSEKVIYAREPLRDMTTLKTAAMEAWKNPHDLPELGDDDRLMVYLAFDSCEVKLADWVSYTETTSEYHATTGVYLGQSIQGGDACYMTNDGFDVRKDEDGRWYSEKHYDDRAPERFYVTGWIDALKPEPVWAGMPESNAACAEGQVNFSNEDVSAGVSVNQTKPSLLSPSETEEL